MSQLSHLACFNHPAKDALNLITLRSSNILSLKTKGTMIFTWKVWTEEDSQSSVANRWLYGLNKDTGNPVKSHNQLGRDTEMTQHTTLTW